MPVADIVPAGAYPHYRGSTVEVLKRATTLSVMIAWRFQETRATIEVHHFFS